MNLFIFLHHLGYLTKSSSDKELNKIAFTAKLENGQTILQDTKCMGSWDLKAANSKGKH